jgi:hypothetical protein
MADAFFSSSWQILELHGGCRQARHRRGSPCDRPGREYQDLYEDWARAREVGEDGCVLVRPDMHVVWRANAMADDPAAEPLDVMSRILPLPI